MSHNHIPSPLHERLHAAFARHAHTLLRAALIVIECIAGAAGLWATLRHRADYPSHQLLLTDIALFGVLLASGLGLWFRRRWATWLSIAWLGFAFVGVLAVLSLGYATWHERWWYWLVPLALPALGGAVKLLRRGPP